MARHEKRFVIALRRELKQLVHRQPITTFLEMRSEALHWEQEGTPGRARGRSLEIGKLREMLKLQQTQLHQLTQRVSHILNCGVKIV